MKTSMRIISSALALSMTAAIPLNVSAESKEEVIYVMAGSDGTVNGVYAVNCFDGGDISDYGDYSAVKLLNVDGNITQNGDEITFSSPENGKVYYQGTLAKNEIPWSISIKYFLDGEELSAEEIAGKSGALEIRIKISENEKCKSDFYEDFALQCSFTLNSDNCRNICADGATIANVGKKKQITYTVLPGRGLEKSIFTNVTDFEMDAGSINGIKMNLGIDIGDDEINDKINELCDGAVELDNGAKELHDGTAELNDGVSELGDGIQKLRDGIAEAQDGIKELTDKSSELVNGSAEIRKALSEIQSALSEVNATVNKLEQFTAASGQIKTGIDSLYSGITELKTAASYDGYKAAVSANGLDIDTLKAGNEQVIAQLTAQITELKTTLAQIQNIPQYAEQAEQLTAQITQLETIAQLLTGSNALIGGTEAYFGELQQGISQLETGAKELKTKYAEFDNAIGQLAASLSEMMFSMTELKSGIDALVTEYAKLHSGIVDYTDGVKKLSDGFAEIADGAKELAKGGSDLADGAKELMDGAAELSDGTAELRKETEKIDSTFSDDLDDLGKMVNSLSGDSGAVKSFVSAKNADISSVQFVIKTDAIKIPEPEEAAPEPEEKLNLWQKLLRLFGLY